MLSVTYSVKLDDSGSQQNVARKEQLAPVERQLQTAFKMATNLRDDFAHMKDREHSHRDTSGIIFLDVFNLFRREHK